MGGVHLHRTPADQASPVPRQLPPPSLHFVARVDEIRQLSALATRSSASAPVLVVISGPGGVGKTTLALNALHPLTNAFKDGHLYADLRPSGTEANVEAGEVLGQFLRALGVPPEKIPIGLAEQQALFRTITAQRSSLLLIDNATSAAQVYPLLPAGSSMTVVTSRQRLGALVAAGGHLVNLSPLGQSESLELLERTIGADRVAREPHAAAELAVLCHGMPIALCGAAARLGSRPERSLAREVAELRDEHRRLSVLSIDETLSVQASFDLSYRELPPQSRRLYRLLSLHPGLNFSLAVAQSAAGLSKHTTEYLTTSLVDSSLLEETGDDRFRFNDLIRIHARECCRRHSRKSDQVAARGRIVEWYVNTTRNADRVLTPYRTPPEYLNQHGPSAPPEFPDRAAALRWLDEERANLMAVTRSAHSNGMAEATWHLCDAQWSLFLYRRHYRDRLEIDEIGVASARSWGNRAAEADMLKRQGRLLGMMGKLTQAVECLTEAATINRSISNRRGEADSIADLARVHLDHGDAAAAIRHLDIALRMHRQRGDDRDVALTLVAAGLARLDAGDVKNALSELKEAHRMLGEHVDGDPYNFARASIALGKVNVRLGEHGSALHNLQEGLALMERFGSEYHLAEVWALLGQLAEASKEDHQATEHYNRALRIYVALDASEAREIESRIQRLNASRGLP
ncbi:hypothetical protein ADL03_42405 [Nocardia sp. NRRL S-836]|nr:hypothetical protein ADL03_42405 [Nocardia sp. NRRL S-836]